MIIFSIDIGSDEKELDETQVKRMARIFANGVTSAASLVAGTGAYYVVRAITWKSMNEFGSPLAIILRLNCYVVFWKIPFM